MDSVRTSGLDDEKDAFRGEDGEVYIHTGTCYHLDVNTHTQTSVVLDFSVTALN